MNKFESLPIEEDTKILFRQEVKFGEHDVLYEKWYWGGITAESIIFSNADVVGFEDKDIEEMVRTSPLLKKGSKITLQSSESGFIFVNFNFDAE